MLILMSGQHFLNRSCRKGKLIEIALKLLN